MKKNRVLNLISLFCNMLIVVFTFTAVHYAFRTDIIRDPMWFGYTGWGSMVFFTMLSNIFVAIISFITLIYNIKNTINDKLVFPKWLVVLKFIATNAMAVTFFTVLLFLAPVFAMNGHGYFTLFSGNNLYMHLLTPISAMITFLVCEYHSELSRKHTFLGLIPVVAYAIVYFTMVVGIKKWEDFYGFTFGGNYYMIPVSVVMMIGATYLFGFLLYFFQKKIQTRLK